ncbi:tRNA-specific adenosine deaminase [Clostridium liquoris]|jgi:tRNA(adenine34) deaminase|uniref:tRNA-specific adenosine deaminase n=1 Tax=Clostridium liquoris TaxID=1289519 RepID=A0A2T0B0P3_9CLOT|nr:nucleoside deaminase [Clostridium liquoris]PRR76940.1 tRNA-specific adenosine deaminase [Clostridium liquoris]
MTADFIIEALKEAKKAEAMNEVPVGAVIVKNGKIIAAAHNITETLKDPTAHAEIIAIKRAASYLKNWRLNGCELYVTLEPCPMCAGAILQSRISKIYIGTFDPRLGACGSIINILQNKNLNSNIYIKWLYNNQCSLILENFFKSKR